jgi:hypothetical protein
MPEIDRHPPGNFCWIEVGTHDRTKAKAFYTKLFGWDAEDIPAGPDMTYTLLKKNGKQVGGLYEMSPEQRSQGIPPHWLSYVAVQNADAAAQKAASLGGAVVMDAFDVMDIGRMAVLTDPTGATFAVWQPKQHQGAQLVGEPGSICWTELATRDTGKAARFYSGLFDWGQEQQDMGAMKYTMYMNAGQPAAGMLEMTAEFGSAPPYWMPYFAVEDCERSVESCKNLGGQMLVPPTDVPNIGRFAVLQDPTGAHTAFIKLLG